MNLFGRLEQLWLYREGLRRVGRKLRAVGRSWKSLDPKPRAFHVQKSGIQQRKGKSVWTN